MKIEKKHHRLIVSLCILLVIAAGLIVFSYSLLFSHSAKPPKSQLAKQPTNTTAACKANLLFMGDTMLARSIGDQIVAGKNPYRYVDSTLRKADMRIANIETTIADPATAVQAPGKLYTFNAPLQAVPMLENEHIDVSVLANNHTSDYGAPATKDMLKRFEAAKLSTVGAGTTPKLAFTALVKTVPLHCRDGKTSVKVAFVAVNDIENNFTAVSDTHTGGAYFDKTAITGSITQARQAGAQFVVVVPHWGIEYQTVPSDRQKEWAHWFIDTGADVVIGGHPHVIQPTELYKGHAIVYSMGNFIFDEMSDASDGQMIQLPITQTIHTTLSKTTADEPALGKVLSIPYRLTADGFPQLK